MVKKHTATFVRDARGIVRGRAQPRFLLRVLRGPDRRREKRSSSSRMVIGSGPIAELRLSDPTVSAIHCELVSDEIGLRVRDLESKNGVFQNGRQVFDAVLDEGDELRLGATSIRVQVLDGFDEHPLSAGSSFGRLRGSSPCMRQLYRQLETVADSDASVLLVGETGTGKELAAEALILHGPRRARPFEIIECARLTAENADTTLFGEEHGGVFERMNGGTVILDEVGELSPSLQPKLLGVLERYEVRRAGADAPPLKLDVRVIATTRHDLERAVNRGSFRADLFFRLAVLQVRLPSLREHAEDIPELVEHFLSEIPGAIPLSATALRDLFVREYPGNVRDLRNTVERFAAGVPLTPAPHPELDRQPPVSLELPYRIQKEQVLRAFQARYVEELLRACDGNISEAARRSGLDRMHLHKLARRQGQSA